MTQEQERIEYAQTFETEALRDMLDSARADLEVIRNALGVPVEPHQSLMERMVDAACARAMVQPDIAVGNWLTAAKNLMGHLSDVLPDDAWSLIDTATWNALGTAVATAKTPAAPDIAEVERLVDYFRDRAMAYATASLEDHGRYLNFQEQEAQARTALLDAVRAIVAERDGLMQTLRDEIDENLRLRELGGALPDENITAMTERLIRERDTLSAQLAASNELAEHMRKVAHIHKQQAQIHAQEARTQRATVHECYQIATGGKGEPGDWHGAEPVRQMAERLAASEARAERLTGLLRDVDDVALKIVSDHGVCDCIDNDGDPYQSQALADELKAIRAALAEGEAG